MRSDSFWQFDSRQPIEHFLSCLNVVDAVGKLIANVREAEQRFASRVFQSRHSSHADFQRDCDHPLDFFGGGPRKLRDDLHDGGRGVGVRFDVDSHKGIAARHRQRERQQHDNDSIVNRPVQKFANHGVCVLPFFRRRHRSA